jgi:hypothetical protein
MAFPGQLDILVTRLTELTERGRVEWQETANPNTYLAPVGKFIVTIAKADSEGDPDYSVRILDQTGKAIERASAMFASPTSEAGGDWVRLRDLHEAARRRALHSEKVVSELLSSLDQIA